MAPHRRSGFDIIFSERDPRCFEAFPVISYEEYQSLLEDADKSAKSKLEDGKGTKSEFEGFLVEKIEGNQRLLFQYSKTDEEKSEQTKSENKTSSVVDSSSEDEGEVEAQNSSTEEPKEEHNCILTLSPGLAKLMGCGEMSDGYLTGKLKDMIVDYKINDLDGNKFAILNDRLHEVLGVRRVRVDKLLSCVWPKHATCLSKACTKSWD